MKKALCMLLALIFMMGAIPAFADGGEAVRVVYENITYEIKDGQAKAVSADKYQIWGEIIIPQSVEGCPVTELDDSAFRGIGMTKVEVPEGVKKIGNGAFNYCDNLEEISLPESLEIIGKYAFANCSMLKEISLPKGLREIGKSAFYDCSLVETINLPESLEIIEDDALPRYVKKITVDEKNEHFATDGTALFNVDEASLVWVASSIEGIYVLPENVVKIDTGAFYERNVKEVVFHENLEYIRYAAFDENSTLKRVVLPKNNCLRPQSFCSCKNLKEVIIGTESGTLNSMIFYDCNIELMLVKSKDVKIQRTVVGSTRPMHPIYPRETSFFATNIKTICAPAGSDAEAYANEMKIPFVALDENKITVFAHGNKVEFDDVEPIIKNDRTLVPMRAIFEALGAEVTWDNTERAAIGKKDGNTVKIKIGEAALYKNGERIELDCAAEIANDRTLVPVRAIAEAFGAHVDWDNDTRCVIITE